MPHEFAENFDLDDVAVLTPQQIYAYRDGKRPFPARVIVRATHNAAKNRDEAQLANVDFGTADVEFNGHYFRGFGLSARKLTCFSLDFPNPADEEPSYLELTESQFDAVETANIACIDGAYNDGPMAMTCHNALAITLEAHRQQTSLDLGPGGVRRLRHFTARDCRLADGVGERAHYIPLPGRETDFIATDGTHFCYKNLHGRKPDIIAQVLRDAEEARAFKNAQRDSLFLNAGATPIGDPSDRLAVADPVLFIATIEAWPQKPAIDFLQHILPRGPRL